MFDFRKNGAVALRMLAAAALVTLAGQDTLVFAADIVDGIPAYLIDKPVTRQSLGLMELSLSGDASRPESWSLRPVGAANNGASTDLVTDLPGSTGLDLQVVGTPGGFVANNEHYYYVTFNVRYAKSCGTPGTCAPYTTGTTRSANLTLMAAGAPTSLGASSGAITAVHYINNVIGGVSSSVPNAATLALSVLPTNPLSSLLTELPAVTGVSSPSLQVFKESEVAGLATSANGSTTIFPYGFVVSCTRTAVCQPNSRSLPPATSGNWDGQVSLAFKVPVVSSPSESLNVGYYFEAMNDSNTRVTQSAEAENYAGDLAAITSATNLLSSDLAILGGSSPATPTGTSATHAEQANYSGYDPICGVRTAGLAATPAGYLVHSGASPTVAAAPYNLPTSIAPGATANIWFCQSVSTPSAANFVVSGSQSGIRSTGTWSGGGSTHLTFAPASGSSFYPGEQVNYSLTGGLTAYQQSSNKLAPFVGSFTTSLISGTLTPSSPALSTLSALGNAGMQSSIIGPAANHYSSGIIAADFNKDGKLDIAMTAQYYNGATNNSGTGGVLVGINNTAALARSISFTSIAKYPAGKNAFAIATGDFNGDGYPDIVSTAFTNSNNIQILLNSGTGTFPTTTPPSYYSGGASPSAVAVGDINGDGRLDLIVANHGSASIAVLLGNGDGTFKLPTVIAVPQGPNDGSSETAVPTGIAIGDFNHDGLPDVAVSSYGSVNLNGTLYIYLNKAGALATAPSYSLTTGTGAEALNVSVGDINGDGYPDAVVANYLGNYVSVFINKADGSGGMQPQSTFNLGVHQNASTVTLADYNGDGKLDIITGNRSFSGLTQYECYYGVTGGIDGSTETYCDPAQSTNYDYGVSYQGYDFGGMASLLLNTSTSSSNLSFSPGSVTLSGSYYGAPCDSFRSFGVTYVVWCRYYTSDSQFVAADFNGDKQLDWGASDSNFGNLAELDAYNGQYYSASPSVIANQ